MVSNMERASPTPDTGRSSISSLSSTSECWGTASRRGSYGGVGTPRTLEEFDEGSPSRLKSCNSFPDMSKLKLQLSSHAKSGLFRMIMDRGLRCNSDYPVIDSLFAEEANERIQRVDSESSNMGNSFSLVDQEVIESMKPQDTSMSLSEEALSFRSECSSTAPVKSTNTNNITVAIRVRPFNKVEASSYQAPILTIDDTTLTVTEANKQSHCSQHHFRFDHVLGSAGRIDGANGPSGSQEDVFDLLGYPLLQSLIQGYNACMLCYGQTGSGKTHTMTGSSADPGVVPRFASAIFHCLEEQQQYHIKSVFQVHVSYLEIYNEKVHDLLVLDGSRTPQLPAKGNESPRSSKSNPSFRSPRGTLKALRVRHHPVKGSFVEGLSRHAVFCKDDILALVKRGTEARATAATRMNERSSRSHAVMTVEICQQALMSEPGTEEVFSSKTSRMHLVDLAGSERASKSDIQGSARFQEMTYINQSLSTLGRVIETLSDSASCHALKVPPYRESTLTWLLVDSFGGNSKTTMIANVSPAPSSALETLSTLRYASRARRIVNKAVINEDPTAALISALQAETQLLKAQLQEVTEKSFHASFAQSLTYQEEVDSLHHKLSFSERFIGELREHEEKERLQWEARLQCMSASHAKHELQQLEMHQQCEFLKHQVEELQLEVQHRQTEAENWRARLTDKEAELECQKEGERQRELVNTEVTHQLQIQLKERQEAHDQLVSQNIELQAQLQRTAEQFEAEVQAHGLCEKRASEMEKTCEGLQGELGIMRTAGQELSHQMEWLCQAMDQKEAQWKKQMAEREGSLAEKEEENQQLQAQLKAQKEAHDQLLAQNTQLQERTAEQFEAEVQAHGLCKHRASELEDQCKRLEEQLHATCQKLQQRDAEAHELSSTLLNLDQQCKSYAAELQTHVATKESVSQQLQASKVDYAQLMTKYRVLNAEMQGMQHQLKVESQEHEVWEHRAKEVEQKLQKHMITESKLLAVLSETGASMSPRGWVVDDVRRVIRSLRSHRSALQHQLQEAEAALAAERSKWQQSGEQDPQQLVGDFFASRVKALREDVVLLEGRVVAAAQEFQNMATAGKDAETTAHDVLVACEKMMERAQATLEEVKALGDRAILESEGDAAPLEQVLTKLDEESHAQWAEMKRLSSSGDTAIVKHLVENRCCDAASLTEHVSKGTTYLVQALVEEYMRMLQSTLENRREWQDLYDGLALTMQAVSGKPRLFWFGWGPPPPEELLQALRRQEELNLRASAWLMGLYAQRDVLKQNVLAQLRINERLAKELAASEFQKRELQEEVSELAGKWDRSLSVIRRLHDENAQLWIPHAMPQAGSTSELAQVPPRAATAESTTDQVSSLALSVLPLRRGM